MCKRIGRTRRRLSQCRRPIKHVFDTWRHLAANRRTTWLWKMEWKISLPFLDFLDKEAQLLGHFRCRVIYFPEKQAACQLLNGGFQFVGPLLTEAQNGVLQTSALSANPGFSEISASWRLAGASCIVQREGRRWWNI